MNRNGYKCQATFEIREDLRLEINRLSRWPGSTRYARRLRALTRQIHGGRMRKHRMRSRRLMYARWEHEMMYGIGTGEPVGLLNQRGRASVDLRDLPSLKVLGANLEIASEGFDRLGRICDEASAAIQTLDSLLPGDV